MTQEFSIAARDHEAGIAKKRFDGMPGRGCLPLITVEWADLEDDLCDFLLRCACAISVEGLQHAPKTPALLSGQACVRWNCAAMQSTEKTVHCLNAIKTAKVERNYRDSDCIGVGCAIEDLQILPTADRNPEIWIGTSGSEVDVPGCRGVSVAVAKF